MRHACCCAIPGGAEAPPGRRVSLPRVLDRFRIPESWSRSAAIMKILVLIPARMGSSRFPGKPMALLLGVPMIEHVYRRVALNQSVTSTVVATCDLEIADHVRSIG